MLFVLAEIAFAALVVGCADAYRVVGSLWALCGAVACACLLAIALVVHVRLPKLRHGESTSSHPIVPSQGDAVAVAAASQTNEADDSEPLVVFDLDAEPVVLASDHDGNVSTNSADTGTQLAPPSSTAQDEGDAALSSVGPREVVSPSPTPSTLDFRALSHELTRSSNPIGVLKRFVGDIRTREAGSTESPAGTAQPCGLERYAARMLEEAGLFASDVKLPELTAVRPRASRMVYLRCADDSIPYLAKLRIIQLEAALNAIRFACASLDQDATMEEAYTLNQGLARSIVAQAPGIDEPLDLHDVGEWPEGEWTVRYGISQAIETLQLPYRLVARYRTNVADGNVAIELDLTPAEVFPRSCFVDGLGIVPTTGDMRQQAAADYALRLGLLMAASAFRCSAQIRHVWIAGVVATATRRSCYYSVDFDRWRFARLDLTDIDDLAETYRSFAPVLRLEDGWLRPVKQGFHLEEERFCPARRYMPVSLSSRRLNGYQAQSLGTNHVSGLSIEEAGGRTLVANAIMMRLAPDDEKDATRKNVRTVLELAADDPDPTVRTAAERVVRGMVEGTLESDVYAVGEEFVRGDELTRANDRAKELMMRQDPGAALRALAPVLSRIDRAGTYDDTPTICYRYYNSYVERALHNRRMEADGEWATIMLVPDAYYEAHLLVSVISLMLGNPEEALAHAQRLVAIAPYDARAHLHVVKCLEMLERDDEAIECLKELLRRAYEPQGVGFAYYRMAFFQWKRGNVVAARACYQYAMRFLPQAVPMMAMELSMLYLQNPDTLQGEASDEQTEDVLTSEEIPLAPTEETSELFYDCARASLDAEIFPVARNFARVMRSFNGDDIIEGLIRSLEDEPDR